MCTLMPTLLECQLCSRAEATKHLVTGCCVCCATLTLSAHALRCAGAGHWQRWYAKNPSAGSPGSGEDQQAGGLGAARGAEALSAHNDPLQHCRRFEQIYCRLC